MRMSWGHIDIGTIVQLILFRLDPRLNDDSRYDALFNDWDDMNNTNFNGSGNDTNRETQNLTTSA